MDPTTDLATFDLVTFLILCGIALLFIGYLAVSVVRALNEPKGPQRPKDDDDEGLRGDTIKDPDYKDSWGFDKE